MTDIITTTTETDHPKMLELTVNKESTSSSYMVTIVNANGQISSIAFGNAMRAMSWIIQRSDSTTNINITKVILLKFINVINWEYDFPLTQLQEEAFMEANFAVSQIISKKA